ncbi:MAG: hypothetical protein AAF652_13160 [Cyanobacteria bacterium P01_C01_bin.72]
MQIQYLSSISGCFVLVYQLEPSCYGCEIVYWDGYWLKLTEYNSAEQALEAGVSQVKKVIGY